MGKKAKGKKGFVVVSQDLHSFNQNQVKQQQEKDLQTAPQSSKDLAKTVSGQLQAEVNKNEEEVSKFQPEDFNQFPQSFYQMDNKLIDAYYTKIHNFSEEEKEQLEAEELLHFIRQINKDLEYILNLRFARFWAVLTKVPEIIRFLDEFLQNVRKHNDLYKLQFIDQYENAQGELPQLREAMSRTLSLVLRVFYRLSLSVESDEEYFSLPFYQKLVYDNWIFDMAKLIDLAAVYGKSNKDTILKVVQNVFDNDIRFVQDFKESVDMLMGLIKKRFSVFNQVRAMLNGESLEELTYNQQIERLTKFLNDFVEILGNFALIASCFPESVIEIIRNTNALLYLANSYCITIQLKRMIASKLGLELPKVKKNDKRNSFDKEYMLAKELKTVKKLSLQSTLHILRRVLLNNVGQHSKNFAVVQNQIATSLKAFILGTTGNTEVSKDVLPKQVNFLSSEDRNEGMPFIKRILKKVDLLASIEAIEDRFMPDEKQFVIMVVESLSKGKRVQVQKIKAVQQHHKEMQEQQQNKELKLQDKENITSIFDMFGGQHSRQLIEQMYLRNDKNFEQTLDMFLTGNIPKDEYKVVVMDKPKQSEEMQIDTSTTQNNGKIKKETQDLIQQYMIGAFDGGKVSKSRKTKNQKYYDEHMRALQQEKEDEDKEEKELRKKMLHLASLMQYEDDFDDQAVVNRNRRQQVESDSDEDEGLKKKTAAPKILQKKQEPQKEDEDDDEVEVDVEEYLERLDQDEKIDYQFQDDEKKNKRQQEQLEQQKRQEKQREDQQRSQQKQGGQQQYQKKDDHQRDNRDNRDYRDNRDQRDYRGQQRDNRQQHHKDDQRDNYNRDRQGGGQYDRKNNQQPQYQLKYQVKGQTNNEDKEQESSHRQVTDHREQRDDRDNYGRGSSYGRGGDRGSYRGGRGDRGGNRGGNRGGRGRGYRDDYQQPDEERDKFYTSHNPLADHDLENKYDEYKAPSNRPPHQEDYNDEEEREDEGQGSRGGYRGRGGRGGRGRGSQSRGGHHDQRNKNLKKQGGYYQ